MFADGHLLLVLHAPPKPDQAERVGRFFWRSPQGEWTSSALGAGIHALTLHIDEYDEAVNRLDRDESQATTVEEYFQILDALAPIHRSVRNLHQVLQEARQLCPDDREILNLRDRAYAIERNAELLFAETKNSLDFLMAKRAEDQSQASHHMALAAHRLNLLVAFFFPIATLTAIFGMNLRHGYEEYQAPQLFLLIIGAGLFLGLLLNAIIARRAPRQPFQRQALSGRSSREPRR
jgi:Mg2+ and Co2+ transporter CorA